jgi:tRNA modification GTPase
MVAHVQDTIVALSSAPGPGGRAIVRLSGPRAADVALSVFAAEPPLDRGRRCLRQGRVCLPGLVSSLPADLCFWPAPHTYTGQDIAEVHTLSCPPLVDLLVAQLLQAEARPAQAGEFTLRAFLAGKLDLTRAEAVGAVVAAGDGTELRQALTQLAGGMATPLQELREDLLNLLADVEAALDFTDEDIRFVGNDETLRRLAAGLGRLTVLRRQIEQRAVTDRPFRVVLAGRPNAGKSSLFNALAGAAALVGPEPGTTRDYLLQSLVLGDVIVELADTPGWQAGGDTVEVQAQALGREQAERADLVLLCLEAGAEVSVAEAELLRQERPPVLAVATKCDLAVPSTGLGATSAVTGAGLDELRELLAERARSRSLPALAPSLARCRHHVDACLEHLRRAHAIVLFEDPAELLALELREALEQLGQMVGAVYTDDLLDRIFSRFCIGK